MSGGFTGQTECQRKPWRETGAACSALYISESLFFAPLCYPEVRDTSVLLHEVDENLRGTLQETNLWPLLTQTLVEYKFTLEFFSFFRTGTGKCNNSGWWEISVFLYEQMLDNSSDLNVSVSCMGKGKYDMLQLG